MTCKFQLRSELRLIHISNPSFNDSAKQTCEGFIFKNWWFYVGKCSYFTQASSLTIQREWYPFQLLRENKSLAVLNATVLKMFDSANLRRPKISVLLNYWKNHRLKFPLKTPRPLFYNFLMLIVVWNLELESDA